MKPRLCVASPTLSLSTTSVAAAATETSADRRCGLTPRRLKLPQGPDDSVLPRREEHVGLHIRQRQLRHRVEVDLRLALLQLPRHVVRLGPVHAAAVLGVEAVALDEERRERARLGVEQVADPAVAAGERGTGPRRLMADELATLVPHLRARVRQLVEPLRS